MAMKMKTVIIFLILLISVTCAYAADEPDEKSVKLLIDGAESMLNTSTADGTKEYAVEEITAINGYITRAKNLLEEKKISEAHYEMKIGVEYFRLIDAKKELYNIKKQKTKTGK